MVRTCNFYTFEHLRELHIELEMHSIISASGMMAESMFEGHAKNDFIIIYCIKYLNSIPV